MGQEALIRHHTMEKKQYTLEVNVSQRAKQLKLHY